MDKSVTCIVNNEPWIEAERAGIWRTTWSEIILTTETQLLAFVNDTEYFQLRHYHRYYTVNIHTWYYYWYYKQLKYYLTHRLSLTLPFTGPICQCCWYFCWSELGTSSSLHCSISTLLGWINLWLNGKLNLIATGWPRSPSVTNIWSNPSSSPRLDLLFLKNVMARCHTLSLRCRSRCERWSGPVLMMMKEDQYLQTGLPDWQQHLTQPPLCTYLRAGIQVTSWKGSRLVESAAACLSNLSAWWRRENP